MNPNENRRPGVVTGDQLFREPRQVRARRARLWEWTREGGPERRYAKYGSTFAALRRRVGRAFYTGGQFGWYRRQVLSHSWDGIFYFFQERGRLEWNIVFQTGYKT